MALDGAALWRNLELDGWSSRPVAGRAAPPIVRINNSWATIIRRTADRDAWIIDIQNFRLAQKDVDNITPNAALDIDDAAAVGAWLAATRTDLSARQDLFDTATNLWDRRQDAGHETDRQHTQRYLNGIRNVQQPLIDTLNRQIADVERRRAAIDAASSSGGYTTTPSDDDGRDATMEDPSSGSEGDRFPSGELSWRWSQVESPGVGGSGGSLGAWVKDVDDRIVDRVVIKDQLDLSNIVESCWDSTTIPGRTLPTEITTMLRVRDRPGSDKIVKLRNWRVDDGATPPGNRPGKFRLYLEYCGFGDLGMLLVEEPAFFPEPYLWKIFDDLVTACIVLDRGTTEPNGGVWDLIVHRDIKTDNVFLGARGQTFCRYPTAKLGDFGCAINVPPNDTRTFDALDHGDMGTECNRPPEQINERLAGAVGRQRMSTKSNIWGIGLCLWGLIQNRNDKSGDPDFEPKDGEGDPCPSTAFPADHRKPFDFDEKAVGRYSNDLLELIMECVEYLPDDRPTLDEVKRRVGLGIGAHTQNLRDVGYDHPDWNGFRPPGRKELYALEGDDDSEDELGGQEGDPMTFLVDAPLE